MKMALFCGWLAYVLFYGVFGEKETIELLEGWERGVVLVLIRFHTSLWASARVKAFCNYLLGLIMLDWSPLLG